MRRKDYAEAIRRFDAAIDLDARAVPAYLNLGDVRVLQGDEREAAAVWEKLIDVARDRAYLAFDRLEALAIRTGNPERFTRMCRRLIDETPQDWRARLALSRHLGRRPPAEALDLLFAALVQNRTRPASTRPSAALGALPIGLAVGVTAADAARHHI
jgi:thioredoxin-like negative regulator of GroEL